MENENKRTMIANIKASKGLTFRGLNEVKGGFSLIAEGWFRETTHEEKRKLNNLLDKGKQPLRITSSKGTFRY